MSGDGALLHAGDVGAQLVQAMDNLETVLDQAGATLAHVVRLNYYTTDVDALMGVLHLVGERLDKAGCRPAQHAVGRRPPRLS